MTTDATLAGKPFTLHRFPLDQKNRSLQAWDSADEYLLDYVFEHHIDANRILIINDAFGALCCALADKHCTLVTDSFVSTLAYQHNLEVNELEHAQVEVLSSIDTYPEDIDLVVLKLPKNAGLLQSQLAKLSKLDADIPVIAAGKAKEIHTSTLKSFTHFLTEPTTSLAVKKSRLIFSKTSAKAIDSKFPVSWPLEKTDFVLSNEANVFSRDSLDIGARFFINYLPMGKKPLKVIDLGCGNGVIGLMTLAKMPNATVTFIDESAMAVHSAQQNISHNLPERVKDCRFIQNDCLTGFENEGADLILCNPPFHQANAITDHIAWQMFMQAKAALRHGGELRIIGNRHLEYDDKLKRLFGNCKILGNNKKFTVLSATKRS
ncbi:methyltransferase [Pseudoalteromonas sp. McH1-7]|uniref:methyltransferase n=1 Tax=Pseudoalteromonas sp. McH1-7 TaxID=2745574 RepID=UPI00159146A6|nr:methyltransferase [Pseudoalteromonas sp. McH1-7]NUZ09773.1 methyltransferase [Pseudoalteromonas sp. McH1-7]